MFQFKSHKIVITHNNNLILQISHTVHRTRFQYPAHDAIAARPIVVANALFRIGFHEVKYCMDFRSCMSLALTLYVFFIIRRSVYQLQHIALYRL